jgi:hypothetical protein
MYKKIIDKIYKENSKYQEEIKTLDYQISVGCRKLKSVTIISKELVEAGFKRGEYSASSMVKGWGTWRGEFNVKNNATYIFIDWIGKSEERFEQLYCYLVEKYVRMFQKIILKILLL